jgi:hypothetical protein
LAQSATIALKSTPKLKLVEGSATTTSSMKNAGIATAIVRGLIGHESALISAD